MRSAQLRHLGCPSASIDVEPVWPTKGRASGSCAERSHWRYASRRIWAARVLHFRRKVKKPTAPRSFFPLKALSRPLSRASIFASSALRGWPKRFDLNVRMPRVCCGFPHRIAGRIYLVPLVQGLLDTILIFMLQFLNLFWKIYLVCDLII